MGATGAIDPCLFRTVPCSKSAAQYLSMAAVHVHVAILPFSIAENDSEGFLIVENQNILLFFQTNLIRCFTASV